MKFVSMLWIAAGAASAATTYTATKLQPAGSPYQIANVWALNNHAQVLVDICTNGNCTGANRLPGVWSNGAITPLTMPMGCTYSPEAGKWSINDSGTVVGWVGCGNLSKVALWTNGVPGILPDAPLLGSSGICTTSSAYNSGAASSVPSGINAAGHITGSTSYPSATPGGPSCSAEWVYNGSTFRILEYGPYPGAGSLNWPYPKWPGPIPSPCLNLPLGYYPGVSSLVQGAAINNADVVLQTENNFFCGPPFISPGVPWSSDPFVTQINGAYSFLPLDSLAGATGTNINDVGDILGYYGVGGSSSGGLVFWDQNGLHNLGLGGYAYMNNVGQVIYSCSGSCASSIAMWQNGVSTPIQLPSGLSGVSAPSAFNDAGQFIAGGYLLSPTGSCAQDLTSQVQITLTGFRYNHSTGLFALIGSVTNTSGAPIPGPISLVVDNLPASATLHGISGATLCAAPQGSPYIDIGNVGAGETLAPGASISGAIDFIDTAMTGITYNMRVLAGPGGR